MRYHGPAESEFLDLMGQLSLPTEPEGDLHLEGTPPRLASPHRISLAGGLALLAQGAAVSALYELRGGASQEVRVDARDVIFTMNPLPWTRRNGHVALDLADLAQPCAGFFETHDERVFHNVVTGARLLDGTLCALGCPNDRDAVVTAFAQRDGEELEQAFASLAGTLVRSQEEWLGHPQGNILAGRPLLEIERVADAPAVALPAAARPLEGIRVADMTHVFAGPTASRCLAEHGADVLHIGPIQPKLVDPVGLTIATGIGKRSAILDLNNGGVSLLLRLLSEADVLVQSWRPGVLDSRGLGPAEVAALRPGIIYVSISCFGAQGPWRERGGFDPNALASTGMTEADARYDTYKISPPGIVTDGLAGFLAAAAITSTLARRATEGGSWHIQISLARLAMWVQSLGAEEAGPLAALGDPRVLQMDTAFGELEYVAPALRFSQTPAYFAQAPVPVGASAPGWLSRA